VSARLLIGLDRAASVPEGEEGGQRLEQLLQRLVKADEAVREAGPAAIHLWERLRVTADIATTEVSLDAVLRQALESLRAAVDADAASILVASEAGDQLIARASVGLPQEMYLGLRIPAGAGMAGRVLSTREALVVDDLAIGDVVSDTLPASGLRSVVAVPITSQDRVLGVLHAASREVARFGEREVGTLALVASRLGTVMDRVRLFESERVARSEAEALAQRLSRLQAVTASLAAALDVGQVHEVISTQLSKQFGAALLDCLVWLRDGSGTRLVPVGDKRVDPSVSMLPIDSGRPEAVAACRLEPIWVTGDAEHAPWLGSSLGSVQQERGIAALPLVVDNDLLGVLAVHFVEPRAFDEADRHFFRVIADEVAQAIDRARLHRSQAFLLDTTHMLAEAPSYGETLERLASMVTPALADLCFIDLAEPGGRVRREVARHADASLQALTDVLRVRYSPGDRGRYPGVEAIRTGRAVWAGHLTDEDLRTISRDEEHFRLVKTLGFTSYLAVPLIVRGEVLGAMTLVSAGSGRRFRLTDVAFVEELARHVAAVVDKARRHEQEHHRSRVLQASLLPGSLPEISGLRTAVRYLPGTTDFEVGGDFYDIMQLPGGDVGFVIGDVAGHDAAAAAVMGQLRSAIRALAGQVDGPAGLVEALRASWPLLDFERIATALFAQLTPGTGDLRLASAGHLPPLMAGGGSAEIVPVRPEPPLGAPSLSEAREWRGHLAAGDVLLLYTDGLVEDRRRDLGQGIAALRDVVATCPADPEALCARIVEALAAENRDDDVAMLAILRPS
jgi:GAF domain-containing protein